MFRKHIRFATLSGFLILVINLAACKSATPTVSADAVLTEVAQTVDAAMATVEEPTATNTLSPTTTPTSTPTVSPSPTLEEILSPSPTQSRITPGITCDSATFTSDVTIPDGTRLASGTSFTKTWKIQNSGTCTWTPEYSVGFSSGSIMDAETPQFLVANSVPPGGSVDISVEMVAPESTGQHIGYWQMQNAAGVGFGDIFYVDIYVTEAEDTPIPTSTSAGITETPTSTSTVTQGGNTATATATPTQTRTGTSTPTSTATSE